MVLPTGLSTEGLENLRNAQASEVLQEQLRAVRSTVCERSIALLREQEEPLARKRLVAIYKSALGDDFAGTLDERLVHYRDVLRKLTVYQ